MAKPPRSHHKRADWKRPAPARRTGLRSIGFAEAKCGRTERKLIRQKATRENTRRAQLLRVLLQEGDKLANIL
jgi:hypothetical protein